jgi:hypothetical protein
MNTLPEFDERGLLPPGTHEVTFDELRESILASGPEENSMSGWDSDWRRHLVDQAETLTQQLWHVGVTDVFLDGSFAEDKPHPNDIDGYFVCDGRRVVTGELERELNRIDPKSAWTWDAAARRSYRGYAKKQLPMWHAYRVELYPHYEQLSGITDEHGHPLTFPAAFRRRRRDAEPKGIVKVTA